MNPGLQAPTAGPRVADLMLQAAYVRLPLAIVLAVLLNPARSIAQQEIEASMLREARAAVARSLRVPAAGISFDGLKFVRDNLGAVVCGTADGKRFLAGPSGNPPPQIEGALSAPMFNYLWNARCLGMSASAATDVFRRELK